MFLLQLIFAIMALAGVSSAALNTTRSFKLVTQVKANQLKNKNKKQFDGLYLSGYHSGAGMNDAVLLKGKKSGINGFFNSTTLERPNGQAYYNLEFDLGNEFPYAAQVSYDNYYAAWVPMQINAGDKNLIGAYYFSKTGLQFTTSPAFNNTNNGFGGWLVCNWSRDVPQLFMRQAGFNRTLTSNCADVNLMPQYL